VPKEVIVSRGKSVQKEELSYGHVDRDPIAVRV
jgi:hypothetical protein